MSCVSDCLVIRQRLLPWFDENARDLPWRRVKDPYAIWVSEIMLQQTRVAAVIEHYSRFMKTFPTLQALAAAGEDEVLAHWSGLGYYRRARLLHKAAQFGAGEMGAALPRTATELRVLPGVGEYTAAAIASIGFGEAVACVDGNVERVLCRLNGWREGQVTPAKVRAEAKRLLDADRPGDFNQAMMELGALVCLPRDPRCPECPLREVCRTQGEHPVAERKKMASRQLTYAFMLRIAKRKKAPTHAVQVLLERRSSKSSLMPGMWELPELGGEESLNVKKVLTLRHSITDTNYYVTIYEWRASERPELPKRNNTRQWFMVDELHTLPLTGLARKALQRLRAWPGYDAYGPVVRFGEPATTAKAAQ
jgi:A/G-specific adenine glycosylase